eukprot:454915-Rhodomonas_salina.4
MRRRGHAEGENSRAHGLEPMGEHGGSVVLTPVQDGRRDCTDVKNKSLLCSRAQLGGPRMVTEKSKRVAKKAELREIHEMARGEDGEE